jgi:hypothetical protein
MEIKFELDAEKAPKAAVAIVAAYRLCCVSVDTGYQQQGNAIAIIIIIAPRPAPTIKKSS